MFARAILQNEHRADLILAVQHNTNHTLAAMEDHPWPPRDNFAAPPWDFVGDVPRSSPQGVSSVAAHTHRRSQRARGNVPLVPGPPPTMKKKLTRRVRTNRAHADKRLSMVDVLDLPTTEFNQYVLDHNISDERRDMLRLRRRQRKNAMYARRARLRRSIQQPGPPKRRLRRREVVQ